MKTLIKVSSVIATIAILPFVSNAQNSNAAVGKKAKTSTNTSNSSTSTSTTTSGNSTATTPNRNINGTVTVMPGTATGNNANNSANNNAVGPNNFNNTGTNQYNNGTGGSIPGATNNTINTQPNTSTQTGNANNRTSVQPNAAVTQQIKLQGIKPEDHAKILQFARQAGAVTGNIDGETLRISSNNFSRDRFSTLLSTALPDITIQQIP